MEIIKTVGIKDLKNNLSAYLKEVKNGVRILVTDRDLVVAELREPLTDRLSEEKYPLFAQWVREGKIRRAQVPNRGPYPRTGVSVPPGTVQRLIDEDRNDERIERFLLPRKLSSPGLAPARSTVRKNPSKT